MANTPKNILVIRMSALGDVAMTIPVLHSIKQQYPNVSITVISKPWMKPLFNEIGVDFIGIEKREGLKGGVDLIRFFNKVKRMKKWDMVIDLHDVIVSKILKVLFRASGIPVKVIDKGRRAKKELVRTDNKIFKQLPTTFQRYAKVFDEAGLPVDINFKTIYPAQQPLTQQILSITGNKNGKWIGIAPFAQHRGKVYPIEKIEEVAKHFSSSDENKVILFGGGAKEVEILSSWEMKYPNMVSVAGKIRLGQELLLMSYLDVMVSMDSANMHLASLSAVPVVSVWGATHPFAGFYGWNQAPENIVQLDLPCRPCSVYGNKECLWKDYRCMNDISPKLVIDKIEEIIK